MYLLFYNFETFFTDLRTDWLIQKAGAFFIKSTLYTEEAYLTQMHYFCDIIKTMKPKMTETLLTHANSWAENRDQHGHCVSMTRKRLKASPNFIRASWWPSAVIPNP